MTRFCSGLAIICLLVAYASSAQVQNVNSRRAQATSLHPRSRIADKFGTVPLSFEPNVGQTDRCVDFLSHGSGYAVFLTRDKMLLRLRTGFEQAKVRPSLTDHKSHNDAIISMEVLNVNPHVHASGLDLVSGVSNYLIGNDPAKWHTRVRQYSKVRYSDVYPGIDLTYHGSHGRLEYDFLIRPGGDPSRIVLRVGDGNLKLSSEGNLVVSLKHTALEFHKPRIYQVASGIIFPVRGEYLLSGDRVQLKIGRYDHRRTLVIDPVLSYSTYLGGSNADYANAIASDLNLGSFVFLTGSTESTDFPTTSGTFQTMNRGGADVFVTKLNATGTGLVFSTYVGGSGDDVGRGITVDDLGNVYVVGNTTSGDFPTTAGAFQTTFGGVGAFGFGDGFVVKLSPQGNALLYSTYVGGIGDDRLTGVTIDQYNNVYAAVSTSSTNFPTTPGAFQRTCANTLCGGVVKLKSTGAALVYSTYLAGSGPGEDQTFGIVLDTQVHAYVTGMTGSPNFPVTSGAFQTRCGTDGNCNGTFDAYVAELNQTGTGLIYSTFLGGSSADIGLGITLDPANAVYVYGGTDSNDFPVTSGAAQTTFGGSSSGCIPASLTCGDNFITKLNSTGSALVYSTYLGGSGDEDYSQIETIAIDKSLNAWVSGQTGSTDFPVVGAVQSSYGGGMRDAFVTELNATGTAFLFSTYLGGTGNDYSTGIAVPVDFDRVQAQLNATYITGVTTSPNFPVVAGAFQPICGTDGNCNGGVADAFVTKIVPAADLAVTNSAPATIASGSTLTYTIVITNKGPDVASSITLQDSTPSGTTFSSISASTGTCTAPSPGGTGTVKCTISTLAVGANVIVSLSINVTAASGNTIKDTAAVGEMTLDPNRTNNSALAKTTVM